MNNISRINAIKEEHDYMNAEKLILILRQKNVSITSVCRYLNIARSTFYRKLERNSDNFYVSEVQTLAKAIPLTKKEINDIFFSNKSH